MRRPRIVLAGLLTTAVVATGAVTIPSLLRSNPAQAATTATEGELLPPAWDDDQQHFFRTTGTSSSYFAYVHDEWSGERDRTWHVMSMADGRTAIETGSSSNNGGPAFAGQYMLKSSYPDGRWGYEYVDPATSESKGTVVVDTPALCAHPAGVLYRKWVADDEQLWIKRLDGTEQQVMTSTGEFSCLDMDDRAVLLSSPEGLRLLDVETGDSRSLTTASPDWAALTPGRVIWRTGTTTTTDGSVQHFAWADREGQGHGTVDLPFAETPQTLGDDLLLLQKVPGGTDYHFQVRRVSVADGSVSAPLLTDARGGTSLDNGTFRVGRPTSIDVLSPDGGRREVLTLPQARERAWGLALSGDRIVASWNDGWTPSYRARNLTVSDAAISTGTEWSLPKTTIPGLHSSNERIQLGGDVLVTRPDKLDAAVQPNYVVKWPGGQREINAGYLNLVELGRGGRLLSYHPLDGTTASVVEDARTGERLGTASDTRQTAIDGTWVWTGPDSTGVLTGRDVTTGQVKTVKTALAPCDLSVVGRWAMSCGRVVDLLGIVPDRTIPNTTAGELVLGNGFVVSYQAPVPGEWELVVIDLNDPDGGRRVYGPVSVDTWRSGRGAIAVDDTGAPRFVYVDTEDQVRMVAVDWLKPAPPTTRPDQTAPTLTSATAGPRVSPTQSIAFGYSFSDPNPAVEPASGVASYDVRFQQRTSSTAPYGEWQQQWTGTTATKVTMTAAPGVDTCFQVRATDQKGNVSPWSAAQCTQVDGTKPTLFSISAGDRVRYTSAVKFSFSYRDNTQLSTYDVVYRTAPAGRSLGQWVFPASWQKIRTTSVSMTAAVGSDTCFMVRARDAAGNLSAWSTPVCTSLPLDDRSLSVVGSVTRATTTMGIYGTASRLNKPGAGLYRAGQVGNRIAVVALSGPGQGAVDVWHAGRKLGRISLAATTWSRRTFYLPVTPYVSGTVSIVSARMAYAWIDGFTALRY